MIQHIRHLIRCGRRGLWGLLCLSLLSLGAYAQDSATQELLRQQERERALREQQETSTDVRLPQVQSPDLQTLPTHETPCFTIRHIRLIGELSQKFQWALKAADPVEDPASGRCLGVNGINVVMSRMQNAIVARGFITTRVLAQPQDLNAGELVLTLIPGRVRNIRLTAGAEADATFWNAMPVKSGDLLDLRAIEQALENFKRVPTVEADIQIAPADGPDAQPGQSDLVIQWTQKQRARINLTVDDSGSKATGRLQAGATVSFDHFLWLNDLFYVNYNSDITRGGGKGTKGYTFHYSIPFRYWLAAVTRNGYSYYQAVAGSTQSYVYSGISDNTELRISRLLYRDTTRKIGAYGRAWQRSSNNNIDDTEVLVQRRRMAGWEFGLTHRQFVGASTLDLSAGYRQGTGTFNSLPAPEEAFGEGTSRPRLFLADMQFGLPFILSGQKLRYNASLRAQWNRTPLVPQDRFAIGGRYTVRGFDGELSLVGERGWLWRNDLAWVAGAGQELYVALDIGRVGGPSAERQLGKQLTGTALGMRGTYRRFAWDIFAGTPVDKPDGFRTADVTTGFNLSASF